MLRKNILVVDDSTIYSEMMEYALSRFYHGTYNILSVDSAERALSLLEQLDFSALLLDLNLHGISGLDALKTIRTKSDIPIIIMSSDEDIETQVKCFESGADHFIPKSKLNPLLVFLMLNNLLKRVEKKQEKNESRAKFT